MRSVVTIVSVALVLAATGCAQTSKVDDAALAPARLAATRKAVAVMRLGSASPSCNHVGVLLGVREGDGFRRHTPVGVANVRALGEPQVAEVELDAGEYHIVAYSCVGKKGPDIISDPSTTGGLYRASFAHFSLAPGEIVNVGYFHFGASREGRSTFGRAIRTDIEVTDWPLDEIERFRKSRPAVYAQMSTRLMTISGAPLSPGEQAAACENWRKLVVEGKAQNLPPGCGGPVPARQTNHPRL